MLTFVQFLNERLFRGYSGTHGYAELFVQPTPEEVQTLFDEMQVTASNKVLGGWLSPHPERKLYVWDRGSSSSAPHKEIVDHALKVHPVGNRPKYYDWWPFYLRWNDTAKIVTVTLAPYTLVEIGVATYNPAVVETLFRTHPVIQTLLRQWQAKFKFFES